MVDRLKAAWNVNVKHTEFEGADHRAGGKGVFRTVELLDWAFGGPVPAGLEGLVSYVTDVPAPAQRRMEDYIRA